MWYFISIIQDIGSCVSNGFLTISQGLWSEDLYYNPDSVGKLTDDVSVFILVNECYHS